MRELIVTTIRHGGFSFTFQENPADPFMKPTVVDAPKDWHYFNGSVKTRMIDRAIRNILRVGIEKKSFTQEQELRANKLLRC